jgi:hypothetical protein
VELEIQRTDRRYVTRMHPPSAGSKVMSSACVAAGVATHAASRHRRDPYEH